MGIGRAFVNSDGVVIVNSGWGDIQGGNRVWYIGHIIVGAASENWREVEGAGIGREAKVAQQAGSANINGDIIGFGIIAVFGNNNYFKFVLAGLEVGKGDVIIYHLIIAEDNGISIAGIQVEACFLSLGRQADYIVSSIGREARRDGSFGPEAGAITDFDII